MRDEAVAARDPAAPAVPRSAASCRHPAYAEPLIKLPLAAAADLLPTKTPPPRKKPRLGPPVVRKMPDPKAKAGSASKILSEIRPSDWLRGQDLNLRPSGYEATAEGLQGASEPINPAESLDSPSGLAPPPMQTASSEHKNFGQPVVSAPWAGEDRLLTPAQAAAQFQVPEYLLRKACAQGRIEHRRVV